MIKELLILSKQNKIVLKTLHSFSTFRLGGKKNYLIVQELLSKVTRFFFIQRRCVSQFKMAFKDLLKSHAKYVSLQER